MKSPAFQFYVKQWLGDKDVLLMDWDARAMHMHYMCIAWQENPPCSLLNDDHDLRKLVGNPANWLRLKKQIFRAWILAEGRWYQIGLLREYLKQKDFAASRKEAAMKRWHPDSKENSPDARAMLPQCICNALQSSSSSADIKPPTPLKGGDRKSNNRRTRRLAVGASLTKDKDAAYWARVRELKAQGLSGQALADALERKER